MKVPNRTIRIAIAWEGMAECAVESPPCERPGLIPELTMFAIRLVLPTEWALRRENFKFIPAVKYGFDSEENSRAESQMNYSDTVLGLVLRGDADFTEADLYLSPLRTKDQILPSISFRDQPTEVYFAIASLALAHVLFRCLLLGYGCGASDFLERMFVRNRLVLIFFYGMLLKFVGAQFVFLFGRVVPNESLFRSTLDVIEGFISGQFTPLGLRGTTGYPFFCPEAHAGKSELFDRMIKSCESNKPVIANYSTAMDLLLFSKTDYVYYAWTGWERMFKGMYCGFDILLDDHFVGNSETMYYSGSTNLPVRSLNGLLQKVIGEEHKRLKRKYEPREKKCHAEDTDSDKKGPVALKFSQVHILFWMFGAASAVAIFTLVVEKLASSIRAPKQHQKEFRQT